ncbi:olfactory receptor 2AT4-like [Protopterus annectens]|uniref:olfactory receptor 2AT4-like n=1 Tax=Protopterus annectens TaxID=7888 RepID=UPI001CFB46A7|nr:olfactory receptor 2AT4-like [Protopterus annectens]
MARMVSDMKTFTRECDKVLDMFEKRGYPSGFLVELKDEVVRKRRNSVFLPLLGTGGSATMVSNIIERDNSMSCILTYSLDSINSTLAMETCNKNHSQITEFILAGFPYFHGYQPALFIIFLIIYIIILTGNTLILIAVVTDRKLYKPMYFFLCNLAVLDIIFTTTTIPKMLALFLINANTISFVECFAQMCISHTMGEFECLLLMIMAYDRYTAVYNPLHYMSIMNKTFNILMTALSFAVACTVAVSITIFTAQFPFRGTNKINHCFCDHFFIARLSCADITPLNIWSMSIIIVVVFMPFCLVVYSYINIFKTVLKMNSVAGRQKTFSTCSSHLTVVIIYYVSIVISSSSYRSDVSDEFHALGSIFFSVFAPTLNPIIYTLRNKDVQEAVKNFIKARIIVHNI